MAVLKIISDDAEIDSRSIGVQSTNATYIDTTRVAYGWDVGYNESLHVSWPEPAGNTIWIHYRYGQNSVQSGWDADILRFFDANGRDVVLFEIVGTSNRWVLYGDTSPTITYAGSTGPQMIDIRITKNGTTDIQMEVYSNGVLRGTVTPTNAVNSGLPIAMVVEQFDVSNSGNVFLSEFIIADESTIGWRLRQHSPQSFGAFSAWIGDANGVVARRLDTAIRSNTLDARTSFGLTNLPVPLATNIDRVVLQTVALRGSSGLAQINHFFRDTGATVSDAPDIALTTTPQMYVEEFPTNPFTGLAWVDTELTDLQYGIRART